MSLLDQSRADFHSFVSDTSGFSQPCSLTNPDGASGTVQAFCADVYQLVDMGTGEVFAGRQASVSVSFGDMESSGLGDPSGASDTDLKPWVVSFDDARGTAHTFKIVDARPDRTIGAFVCVLESYIA